jgi:hypothetical protein
MVGDGGVNAALRFRSSKGEALVEGILSRFKLTCCAPVQPNG